jgi:hypothetical protein
MSVPIYDVAYSGYKANELPLKFTLDEGLYEIEAIEEQWRSPEAGLFEVLTPDGKHYVLR